MGKLGFCALDCLGLLYKTFNYLLDKSIGSCDRKFKEDLICAVNPVYHHLINYDFPKRFIPTLGA